ncbi:MAG TPA: histone deacetylase family protein [Chloroflexota bacterium]|nr:histone deacetylase family protein [Chloroflexota bacterium]
MPVVYDPAHRRHSPRVEILYGRPLAHPEQPERVEAVRQALVGTRWEGAVVSPRAYPLELAETVHDAAYVVHLGERGVEAESEGLDGEWFPYVFARDRSLDTGTPIQRGTMEVAWASACVALTATDLVREGSHAAYGLCRPPGHHASRGASGGYCYFNNAALAAARLMARGVEQVAILDLDIHHGNGTQDIFWRDERVLYCSIHGEPEWAYPPHTGFAGETGAGAGAGTTFNQPLPQGTTWGGYRPALQRALERIVSRSSSYLVLSQGFDTHEGDRWGGFLLHAEDYAEIGRLVRSACLPVVALLEGGYEPANLAAGSLALLGGLS